MRQGAQGWCTWMTLRDGMGKEVERVSGLGTHVHPRLIHVHVWQKPLQYCKLIKPQLNIFFLKARHALSLVTFSFPSHFNAYC